VESALLNLGITLRYEKSSRPAGYAIFASLLGYVFVFCSLVLIVKIPFDIVKESKQSNWPTAVATIEQRAVQRTYRRGYEWHIETEVRYTVDGEEMTSSIRSRVGSYGEEQGMYRWASQHPPGTPLPLRYDPQRHNMVVLDGGDMPESGSQVQGDLQMLLIFSVLSVTLITIGRVLQRRREERSMLNRDNTNE
jgi:hypothetical protein